MNHTDRMKQNGKNQKTGGRHFSACRCGKDDAGRGNFICEKNPEAFEKFEAAFPKKEKLKLLGQLF